MTGWLSEHLPT